MRVLVATDHRFLHHQSGVFDTYCFDSGFFSDYRQVFDTVIVVSRARKAETLPTGATRSDGGGVKFIDIPDIRGLKWLVAGGHIAKTTLLPVISQVDAVIVRVPSELGWYAARQARKLGKPYMIEVIGDPKQAVVGISKGIHYRFIAWLQARRLRELAEYAKLASYVSKYHLQEAYPLPAGRPHDSISSIRLAPQQVTTARTYTQPLEKLKIVLVASLVPIKRHEDLIQGCRYAIEQGINLELHLAGDGPRRSELEKMCHHLNMESSVIFHGHIADQQSLTNLLDSCDLFVMTSASEGLPRAMIEAMARGLPAAGSKTGGIAEIVRSSEQFSVQDTTSIGNLIVNLANNPERLTEMSLYSINIAKQYTSAVLSPRRVQLYRILRDQARSTNLPLENNIVSMV